MLPDECALIYENSGNDSIQGPLIYEADSHLALNAPGEILSLLKALHQL